MSVIHDAKDWRAIEARALAQRLTDPETKRVMLSVAEDCEWLAAWAEEPKAPAP